MKNKSLKLKDLKVQSFVTSLSKEEKQTVKGGDETNGQVCDSVVVACKSGAPACQNTDAVFCHSCQSDPCACVLTIVIDNHNACNTCPA